MSQDLYQSEIAQSLSGLRPVASPEAGTFDNFVSGAGRLTMKGLAGIGSGVDILGGALARVQDKVMGTDTEAQDRYFKEHEDVFGSAMDYWTPRPNEVGVAAEVVGGLVSTLPMLLVAPELVLAGAYGRTSEELVRKGVPAGKAQAVGALETGGLALGLWMPVLGSTGWERVLVGGAAYNAAQGIITRGAASEVLKDTAAREDYRAFDPQALTLDVLLGLAFGTFAHLAPSQRAAGEKAWGKMMDWAKQLSPSDVDAIVALRQAEHLNVDSAPGKMASAQDVEAHAQRLRTALDQLAKGDQVAVDAMPQPRVEGSSKEFLAWQKKVGALEEKIAALNEKAQDLEGDAQSKVFDQVDELKAQRSQLEQEMPRRQIDPKRQADAEKRVADLTKVAEKVRTEEGIAPIPTDRPVNPNLTPEQRVVESRFWDQMQDYDAAKKAYSNIGDTEGGKILSTDIARELSPDYNASKQTRSLLAETVHEPASDFVKKLYAEKLLEPSKNGLNLVTFTAGGTGAGKTSAISKVAAASAIVKYSDIVYDTNLNNFRSAEGKIQDALDAGKRVAILYVGRDPVDSFVNGALPRAMEKGRTVPIGEHAKTHIGVAESMGKLAERYADNPKVDFVYLDNRHGKGNTQIGDASLPRSFDLENLDTRLKESLDAERKAGRISEDVYRGFVGDDAFAAEKTAALGAGEADRGAGAQGVVGKLVHEKLVAAGLPKEEAAANSAIWDSFFETAGKRYGVDPMELLGKYGVDVQRTSREQMAAGALEQRAPLEAIPTEKQGKEHEILELRGPNGRVGEASISRTKFGDGKAWIIDFLGLDKENQKKGLGLNAVDAVVERIRKLTPDATHVTAELMSKDIANLMVRRLGEPQMISDDIREYSLKEALERLPDRTPVEEDGITPKGGNRIFMAWPMPEKANVFQQSKIPHEDLGGAAPKPGEKFIVYRVGSKPTLEGRNGGNSLGVAEHLARLDDFESPQPVGGGAGIGGKIFAYEVTATDKLGRYDTYNMERGESASTRVGRRNNQGAVAYSFPKGGDYEAKLLGAVDVKTVRAQLKKQGFKDFDDSGFLEGSKAIRQAFAEEKILGQDTRGAIQLEQGRTLIGLFEHADASTIVHESGHFFLEVTKDLAGKADAPEAAMNDWAALTKWMNLGEGGTLTREAHEKFARGFESYLMEGKAPNTQLAGIFEQFKEWLTKLYQNVSKLNVPMTDEIRGVMDRMLGTKTEAPAAESGRAEPPPPRGSAAEAAGATANPHLAEAERLVGELPDLTMRLGTNADGSPMMVKAADYIGQVKQASAKMREDSKLLQVAAECMMGIL